MKELLQRDLRNLFEGQDVKSKESDEAGEGAVQKGIKLGTKSSRIYKVLCHVG